MTDQKADEHDSHIFWVHFISLLHILLFSRDADLGDTGNSHIYSFAFSLAVAGDFRWLLSQFSTNCHEILQALFSSRLAITLELEWD